MSDADELLREARARAWVTGRSLGPRVHGLPEDECQAIEARAADLLVEDEDYYFGRCPVCRERGRWLNVEADHWLVCDEHKLKWCVGSNLTSCWKTESPGDWTANAILLEGYTEIDPADAGGDGD